MSNIVGSLGIKLTADASGTKRVLKDVGRDLNKVERQLNHQQRTWKNWSIQSVAATVAIGMAVGATARRVLEYSDALQSITNKLKITTSSQAELNQITEEMLDMAVENRSSIEGTVDLYTKLHRSTKELGMSTGELKDITDTIQKSFIIGGATSREMEGAVRQLGQALASGALRGEEFNSVSEQAPLIMEAVKEATGKNAAELRKLAAQGAITTEILVKSLELYRDKAVAMYGETEDRFSDLMQKARTEAIRYVKDNESIQDAVRATGQAFLYMAENLDTVISAVKGLAAIYGGILLQSIVKSNAASSVFIAMTGQKITALRAETAELARQGVAQAIKIKNELNLAIHTEKVAIAEAKKAFQTGNATKAMKAASIATAERLALERAYLVALGQSGVAQGAHTALTTKSTVAITAQNAALKIRNFLMGNWVTLLALGAYSAYEFIDWETDAEKALKKTTEEIDDQIASLAGLSEMSDVVAQKSALQDRAGDLNEQMNEIQKRIQKHQREYKAATKTWQMELASQRKAEAEKELAEKEAQYLKLQEGLQAHTDKIIELQKKQNKSEEEEAELAYLLAEANAQRIIEVFNQKSKSRIQLAEEEGKSVIDALKVVAEAEENRARDSIENEAERAARITQIRNQLEKDTVAAQEETKKRIEKLQKDSEEAKEARRIEKRLALLTKESKSAMRVEQDAWEEKKKFLIEQWGEEAQMTEEHKQILRDLEAKHKEKMDELSGKTKMLEDYEKMQESLMSERALLEEQHAYELALLNTKYSEELRMTEEYLNKKRELEKRHSAESEALSAQETQFKVDMYANAAKDIVTIMSSLGVKSKGLAKIMFLAEKAQALANAWVNTQAGIMKAYSIDPTGVLASNVALMGKLSMAAIAASTLAGVGRAGGGATTKRATTTTSTSSGGRSSAGGSAQAPQASRNISINLTGGSLFSADQVRELIGQINEQVGDGVTINTGG